MKGKSGLIAGILVLALSVFALPMNSFADTDVNADGSEQVDIGTTFEGLTGYSYSDYYEENSQKTNNASGEIVISSKDYKEESSVDVTITEGCAETTSKSIVEYEFRITNAGFYHISVDYLSLPGSGTTIMREVLINGEVPFYEASLVDFERHWEDESNEWLMMNDKNYASPSQIEVFQWQSKVLESSERKYGGPYMFYFEAGTHTLTFVSVSEPMMLGDITLQVATEVPTYEEFKGNIDNNQIITLADVSEPIIIQSEDTYSKSTSVLLPANDRTSAVTQPYHSSNILMNTIGGTSWSTPGDEIVWSVTVPEAGYYKVAFRSKQSYNRDFYSMREIKINDEVQFAESNGIKFYYDTNFALEYVGDDEGEEYLFYFNEGENQVSLTVSLSHLSSYITDAQTVVNNFNALYRELVAVMGSTPDQYRDYKIETVVPTFIQTLTENRAILQNVVDEFGTDKDSGGKMNELTVLLLQIDDLLSRPNNIAKQLATFSSNISALGEWSMSLGSQQLTLDYMVVAPTDYKLGASEGNIFQNTVHTVSQFIGSFTNDYKVVPDDYVEKEKTVEVWLAVTSRDQYDVVQRMINKSFVDADYNVNIRMVTADAIMPSTLTGNGPDIAIQINSSAPTDFAFRGAAYDLSLFDDFEEVIQDFPEGIMEYFEYQDGYYALPDQISFPVMFYRTDILTQLGLEVPDTWDEVLSMIPYFQSEGLSIYFDAGNAGTLGGTTSSVTKQVNSLYQSMLYQQDITLYRDSGAAVNFDQDDALVIFKDWTEYYTKQGLEVSINFVTRFRTGETPLAIVDYTNYNTLAVAAPEIVGNWSIAPIPGIIDEDGNLNRAVSGVAGAAMMIKPTVESKSTQQEAWDFLKWWVSEDTQVEYAKSLEAILGSAARYPVANIYALDDIIVEDEMYETMMTSMENLRGTPQVPGGYLTGRSVEAAFLSVYNNNSNPYDTLYDKIDDINAELTKKRIEFGIQ